MRTYFVLILICIGLLFFFSTNLLINSDENKNISDEPIEYFYIQSTRANNSAPVLSSPSVYHNVDDEGTVTITFEVIYSDADGDEGTVLLHIENEAPENMRTSDFEPTEGQYYFIYIPETDINDDTEFYFSAEDNNGSSTTLQNLNNQPFLVGDYLGWGDEPILSNPDVYFDGDDWVFNVTYRDLDGDEASYVSLYINDEFSGDMDTEDTDPFTGQNYIGYVRESEVDEYTEFYFEAQDTGGSYSYLYDENWENFVVGNLLDSNGPDGTDGDENGDGDGGGFALPEGWNDPEVIVGIVALLAMGIGSAVGVWLRKRKRRRFSDLLSKIDDVYGSYKTHPRKCETELEKIRAEVDEDLKRSTIDENNYSILKDRLDEIMQEIRGEVLRSQVQDLPKDMELRIKDMLIDGKITKTEYDKFMKAVKGSAMTTKAKEQMEKLVATWMREDAKKGKK